MSWSGEVVTIVRNLIWDVDSGNYTYSDDRLLGAVFSAAQLVSLDVSTVNEYDVDAEARTVTPDPDDPRDIGFINLTALKVTANITAAEAKLQAGRGISITDGPSTINTLGQGRDLATQAKMFSDRYELYKRQYAAGRYGKAVITPSTVDEIVDDSFGF